MYCILFICVFFITGGNVSDPDFTIFTKGRIKYRGINKFIFEDTGKGVWCMQETANGNSTLMTLL